MRMTTKKKSSSNIKIPGDLIVEILLRLPPISVVRFQGVCKQWYSLISNPDFQRTHSSSFQSHQQQQQHEITNNDQFLVFQINCITRVEFVPLTPFKEEKENHRKLFHGLSPLPPGELVDLGLYAPRPRQQFPLVRCSLIDSCNGLFLYDGLSCDKHGTTDYATNSFYICNPITKKYFKLPNIMDERKRKITLCFKTIKLVFDPSISHSYKVLMVLWPGCSVYAHTEYWHMYSSETGTWRLFNTRNLDPSITDCDYDHCSRSVLLNGVLYWSHRFTTSADTSLCFDVEKESLGFLPLPPKPNYYDHRNCNYFGKCDGRLRLIETLMNPRTYRRNCSEQLPFSFDVMETETEPQNQQDGSVCCTWIVKYRVNDIRRVDDFFSKHSHSLILHCYKMKNRRGENEEVLLVSVDIYGSSFVYFSLRTKKFIKELAEDFERERRFLLDNAFAYTPTLFHVFAYTPTLFPVSR